MEIVCMYVGVSKFVAENVFNNVILNSTMNATMNLTNSDKGLKQNYFFHLHFYFSEYVLLRFIPKGQKSLVFKATRP